MDGLSYFKVGCLEIDLNRKIVNFSKINRTNNLTCQDCRHFCFKLTIRLVNIYL